MLCFEVLLNNEKQAIAGGEQAVHLVTDISKLPSESLPHIQIYGLLRTGEKLVEDAMWNERTKLQVGDEVRIKIIESDSPDEPIMMLKYGTYFDKRSNKILYCSFCSSDEVSVGKIFEGVGGNICRNCASNFASMKID